MMIRLESNEVIGFLKPAIDVHTLGITTVAALLKDCGYKTVIANNRVSDAVMEVNKIENISILLKWLQDYHITRLGFSYRLDPLQGKEFFCKLLYILKDFKAFDTQGGILKDIFFAGLPDTCKLIEKEFGKQILLFQGDESPLETLKLLGVPEVKLPSTLKEDRMYDESLYEFGKKIITEEKYNYITYQDHYGYPECGKSNDSLKKRLVYSKNKRSLPLIRVHAGPYNPDRLEAINEFLSWTKELADSKLLDVLSIGTSQLSQSNFGEDWNGMSNGGGVPINSPDEFMRVKEAAKPMLVRTYAGTKNVPYLAEVYEKSLNISWHALSFWWFCEIDGRGKNTVLENLKEHFEAIRYIAYTQKPLEPIVPHHFAFRGADDLTFIITGFFAAKSAKLLGIKHLVLQNMLNTPKYTSFRQDVAKGKVLIKLIRELEDDDFTVSLQLRAGLDYFAPDLEKAKIQLAAVSALMDDLEPENENSPEIIHVVSYSEAVRLATPPVIKESIKITLHALNEYRNLKRKGVMENMAYDKEVNERSASMYEEAKEAILFLEKNITNLYTPEGLFTVFKEGFFPLPYLVDLDNKYPLVKEYSTAIRNGGIRVVNESGNIVRTLDRYKHIMNRIL